MTMLLQRSTVLNALDSIQRLSDVIPEYKRARKNSMATLVANIGRLNTPDFPYEWFKDRCINKMDILKLPENSFVVYTTLAGGYLTQKQARPIVKLSVIYLQRMTLKAEIIGNIFIINKERRLNDEEYDISNMTNADLHTYINNHGVAGLENFDNRKLLIDVARQVRPPRNIDVKAEEKEKADTIKKYIEFKDDKLILTVKNMIREDEQQIFSNDCYYLSEVRSKVRTERENVLMYMKRNWGDIPPNLVKGKTPAKLRCLSDEKFQKLVSSFASFKQLHPNGPKSSNPSVVASVCVTKKRTKLENIGPSGVTGISGITGQIRTVKKPPVKGNLPEKEYEDTVIPADEQTYEEATEDSPK